MTSLVWFRQDLRTIDNPALTAALEKQGRVVCLYIWSPEENGDWSPGAASRWWLHHSLLSLSQELGKLGLQLVVRRGKAQQVLEELVRETEASSIFWNRCYEPLAIARDSRIKSELTDQGLTVNSFSGTLLYEPWTVANKQNRPYQVFTPFWKRCRELGEPAAPLPTAKKVTTKAPQLNSLTVEELQLLPKIHWDAGLKQSWTPGTSHGLALLKNFKSDGYSHDRDFPAIRGTSHLAPYLHFGEVSARMIWHHCKDTPHAEPFLRQLGWREFAHHLLYHFPHTPEKSLREDFTHFPWNQNKQWLQAWQQGKTGYPIVDAGMRELWKTGWMHNRVRMIVGSFLVKDLLLSWQEGAAWFWDTLVDADLANNTLGWQWVGGCGADAAPYFRIFNPITQGEKFDPEGRYTRQWVPELARLPDKWLQKPWEAPLEVLKEAGVSLGIHYPERLVDHGEARLKALEAFQRRV